MHDQPVSVTAHELPPSAPSAGPAGSAQGHWEGAYRDRGPTQVSWFQPEPQPSLDLIQGLVGGNAAPGRDSVIDVGGGASPLAARLIEAGLEDVTVLDVSEHALRQARAAAGHQPGADKIHWVRADLLTWRPDRTWSLWHDRAVFHFLTDSEDRATYLATMRRALEPGGTVVLGTFAADGPTHCSGLPARARCTPS